MVHRKQPDVNIGSLGFEIDGKACGRREYPLLGWNISRRASRLHPTRDVDP